MAADPPLQIKETQSAELEILARHGGGEGGHG